MVIQSYGDNLKRFLASVDETIDLAFSTNRGVVSVRLMEDVCGNAPVDDELRHVYAYIQNSILRPMYGFRCDLAKMATENGDLCR